MAGFKKVLLTERDSSLTQRVTEQSNVNTGVNGFDESYSAKKLNELYNEFDSISIDEMTTNKVETLPTVKSKTSVKTKIYLTAGTFIALLLMFLVIYNFVVINSLNGGIKLLQDEVGYQEYQVSTKVDKLDDLTNANAIEQELKANGYGQVSSENVVMVEVPSTAASSLTADSNWFDAFCNFISSIFGG